MSVSPIKDELFMKRYSNILPYLKLTVTSGLCLAVLTGCGIRGQLKTPPPLFGSKTADDNRIPTQDLDIDDKPDPNDLLDQEFGDPEDDDFSDLDFDFEDETDPI